MGLSKQTKRGYPGVVWTLLKKRPRNSEQIESLCTDEIIREDAKYKELRAEGIRAKFERMLDRA
jgi:hypothetical protein